MAQEAKPATAAGIRKSTQEIDLPLCAPDIETLAVGTRPRLDMGQGEDARVLSHEDWRLATRRNVSYNTVGAPTGICINDRFQAMY